MDSNIKIFKHSVDKIFENVAKHIRYKFETSKKEKRPFSLILSGGNTPKELYRILPEYISDWSNINLFLGDERFVSKNHDDSNQKMISSTLLSKISIPDTNLHFPDTSLAIEDSAKSYNNLLSTYLNENSYFDIILLGLGDDCHTLSLFPETKALNSEDLYTTNYVDKLKSWRLTGTYKLIENSSESIFIIKGANKQNAIKSAFSETLSFNTYPAQKTNYLKSHVSWYLDERIVL